MTYEATLYDQARIAFLQDLSQMNLRNDQFAERKGGVEGLDAQARNAYNMNRDRMIRILQYHDAAQQYIEQLHDWISELNTANRELAAKEWGWQAWLPKTKGEPDREYRRHLRFAEVQILQPELF